MTANTSLQTPLCMPLHRPLAPWHLHSPLPFTEYTHVPFHARPPPWTPLVLAVNRTPQFTIFTSRKDRNCTPSSAPGHSHPPSSLDPLTSHTAPYAHQPPGAVTACHRSLPAPLSPPQMPQHPSISHRRKTHVLSFPRNLSPASENIPSTSGSPPTALCTQTSRGIQFSGAAMLLPPSRLLQALFLLEFSLYRLHYSLLGSHLNSTEHSPLTLSGTLLIPGTLCLRALPQTVTTAPLHSALNEGASMLCTPVPGPYREPDN